MKKKWIVFIVVSVFVLCSVVPAMAVESTWHGQFRINYYSMNQDKDVDAGKAAARLRWRPTWDVKVNNDVSMHMQLKIGHIQSNTSNARYEQGGDPAVAIRHAMLSFTTPVTGGKFAAGLVPMSDKFGDTLFSGDWDFNPLALSWMGKYQNADIRLATGKLMETSPSKDDDLDAFLADIDVPMGNGSV